MAEHGGAIADARADTLAALEARIDVLDAQPFARPTLELEHNRPHRPGRAGRSACARAVSAIAAQGER